jgi:hypothetical protein
MIEGNMSLVISKVDSYVGHYPFAAHLRDDLISEGFVGLCTAVDKMSTEPTPEKVNPTGFISHWVHRRIGEMVDQETGIGASPRTKRRLRAEGAEVPTQINLYDAAPTLPDKIVDPMSMVDLRDMIDTCCESEQDQIIVRMRELGYVDRDIAAAIDAPVTTTYMRRRELYARFLEKSELPGEV